MAKILNETLNADEIMIEGSLQRPAELDLYSDVDMKILLRDNTPINTEVLLESVAAEFAPVLGFEVISHLREDAVRVCLENGMRFDLVFRYPSDKEPVAEDESFSCKIYNVVNQFWFFAAMVLVKLGRKDNLIAAHLSLELCQLLIVIQMLVRDNKKGTAVHRFGDSEIVSAPFNLGNDTADEILAMLLSAAIKMDNELERLNLGYAKKSGVLNSLALHFLKKTNW